MAKASAHTFGPTEGFLWAYRVGDGATRSLANESLPSELRVEAGWIWAHFALADQRARAFLSRFAEMPGEVRDVLVGEDCGARILFSGCWTFGVLPDFEADFDGRVTGLGRMRFAFDETRLITTRRHSLQVLNEIHRKIDCGEAVFANPVDAFIAVNRRYCELAEDHLEDLAAKLDHIEDGVLAENHDLKQLDLGPLRRDLSYRRREVASLRTAYHRASTRHGAGQGRSIAEALPRLQQLTEDVDHEIAALQDRARLVHEEINTKINGATNRALHALTVMTALLMPPTLIVGAFGMNLRGIAFATSAQGFAIVAGICVAALVAAYALLRRFHILN